MADKSSIAVRSDSRLRRLDFSDWFDELQQQMARLWASTWPLAPRPFRRFAETTMAWTPSMDVFEKDNQLVVKAELPGVKKDDISVTLEGNDLIIRGERRSESEVKEEDYYRMERTYGSFYRRLPLGFEVKPEQITANYTDGVLEIRIPEPVAAKPEAKQIKIS